MAPAPLVATRFTGRFLALCHRCPRPIPEEVEAPSLAAARAHLASRGWIEGDAPPDGRERDGRRRSVWQCPACASAGKARDCAS